MTSADLSRQLLPGPQNLIGNEELSLAAGWAGYTIAAKLPLQDAEQRLALSRFLWDVVHRLCAPEKVQTTVWLLLDNLHRDNAVRDLSRNARAWKPDYGLGLWPDQPPPRMITRDDILNMEWGSKPPVAYHRVAKLAAVDEILHHAWTIMFGLGSITLTAGHGGSTAMLKATREFLKKPIVDESFQQFPFYFPLLGRKALSRATPAEMDGWLGPTQLYLRESEEDGAVLLLARTRPEVLREAIAGVLDSEAPATHRET